MEISSFYYNGKVYEVISYKNINSVHYYYFTADKLQTIHSHFGVVEKHTDYINIFDAKENDDQTLIRSPFDEFYVRYTIERLRGRDYLLKIIKE